ncbi:MAG: hypothetical protein FKY71_02465 [Spiribacter salinus]|uniref:Hydantoinase/oxoprolinase N-terminal domain-containing protein n=1 Tax=Spiribacter salinus TaxID=1335746 RepID=A0A540VV22_9GAMM|nr:MAG: hypothetical protein FKY71_02465 [Spiribacter salinus]
MARPARRRPQRIFKGDLGMAYHLGVDVGGTFTDVMIIDEDSSQGMGDSMSLRELEQAAAR